MKNEKRFNVKSKSAYQFLKDNLVSLRMDDGGIIRCSAYNLLQDEMIFKKGGEVKAGQCLTIQLYDRAESSGKELTNIYEYKVLEYDDVSIQLKLKSFSVQFEGK